MKTNGRKNLNKFQADDAKMRELILHISMTCQDDNSFSSAKLNRLLFFSDFIAFKRFGQPITGHNYEAQPGGPQPKALKSIIRKMEQARELAIQERNRIGVNQRRPIALREANLDVFRAKEVSLVDGLIREYEGKAAEEVTVDPTCFIGWDAGDPGETIPYGIARIYRRPWTQKQLERARELEAAANECLKQHSD